MRQGATLGAGASVGWRTGIWAAVLTTGTAVVVWGLEAEKASDEALALAARDAPVEMIVGGAIPRPAKNAQAWHDWGNASEDGRERGDERSESANTPTEPDQSE